MIYGIFFDKHCGRNGIHIIGIQIARRSGIKLSDHYNFITHLTFSIHTMDPFLIELKCIQHVHHFMFHCYLPISKKMRSEDFRFYNKNVFYYQQTQIAALFVAIFCYCSSFSINNIQQTITNLTPMNKCI